MLRSMKGSHRYKILYKLLVEALEGWEEYCLARDEVFTGKKHLSDLEKVKFDAEIRRYYTRRNRRCTPLPEDYRMSPQNECEEEEMAMWALRRTEYDDDIKELAGSNSSCELTSPVSALPAIDRPPLKRPAGLEVDLNRLLGFGAHGRVYLGYLTDGEANRRIVAVKKVTVNKKRAVSKELAVWENITQTPNKYIVKYYGSTFNKALSEFSIALEYCKYGSLQDLLNRLTLSDGGGEGFFMPDGRICREKIEFLCQNDSRCTSLHSNSSIPSIPTTVSVTSESSYSSSASASPPRAVIKLMLPTLRRVVGHLVSGIVYLHNSGVIHRDVKTSNVLVGNDGFVKLCDFGVSILAESGTSDHRTCVGTPGYVAPEVIQEQPYGPSVDIWSLGITILELSTGKRPYRNLNPAAALMRTVSDPHPPFPEDLPPAVMSFLKDTLVKDPGGRATAADLFTHPLADSTCASLFY
eukprot:TRINITY_DN15598_c0_g1_i1.p1 TRINITY_DN15598_c0_g1~~TRINITY_DN15598_c0_g1_i1.p1  ORF type:complete len:523 (+),score=57.07 TRINITY_DN15598_c0_g1_i1:169-1569(+)